MRELDWFDGPEEDDSREDRPRRRRRLLVAATVPWLAVALLLVLGARASEELAGSRPSVPGEVGATGVVAGDAAITATAPAGTQPPPSSSTAAGPDTTAGPDTPADDIATVLEIEELRGRWRVAPGSEEAAALAVALARGWLTGLGPVLPLPGAAPDPTTYAEHLVVEAVEHPSADTSVVTVLAVVLVDPDTGQPRVDLRRLAVPLATGQGPPRPAGAPWELPPPQLTPVEPDLEPVTDPAVQAAAVTALAQAGLGELQVHTLATAQGWPLVVTAGDGPSEQHIWLRPHLDGFVVAGSTLAGAATEAAR